MCGIVGQISNTSIDEKTFLFMRDTLKHRGPDGKGIYFSNDFSVALGHRRLSIIDLSDNGIQPMANEDYSVWITFNGEIYNFQEIKKELIRFGHIFRSNSDTEVIIHAYEQWDIKCVERFRGMFAFGIWDINKKQLILARDPFGIKPLYYFINDSEFIFASELKAIIANPRVSCQLWPNAIYDYFFYRYIPAPRTIWKNIYKLPTATILIFKNGNFALQKYWVPVIEEKQFDSSLIISELDCKIDDSIYSHLISDVSVGLFLSGGIDSSTNAYYMYRQKKRPIAFSVGFNTNDNWHNELPDARMIANLFCFELHEKKLPFDFLDLLQQIMWYFDEPFADTSMLPTFMVSQLASQYVKVALSGDGGDELFAGYSRYFKFNNSISWLSFFFQKKKEYIQKILVDYQQDMVISFSCAELAKLLPFEMVVDTRSWFLEENFFPYLASPKKWQILDMLTILPEQYLTKIDRASMANSLEVRVPFLDKFLAEYVLSLPVNCYTHGCTQKYLLNSLMKDKLPSRILNKKKRGFSIPLLEYCNLTKLTEYVLNGLCVSDGIFNKKHMISIIDAKHDYNSMFRIWQLVVFEAWYRMWGSKVS